MAKRLIVCIDGTTNATEVVKRGAHPTNVVRFARAVRTRSDSNEVQIVEYIPGVATDVSAWAPGRIVASVLGKGLSQIVQEAYEFLSNNYEVGDRVYVLGFSRGAAAARSLSGLTELFGVLPPGVMDQFGIAWKYYNRAPTERSLKELKHKSVVLGRIAKRGQQIIEAHRVHQSGRQQQDPVSDPVEEFTLLGPAPNFDVRDDSRIGRPPREGVDEYEYVPMPLHFVGVWDTVLTAFQEGFQEMALAWNVGRAYQALAIHETRRPYQPVLWQLKCPKQLVVQTWFPGAHSDIGGGTKGVDLSSWPLRWMVEKAQATGLAFNEDYLCRSDIHKPNPLSAVSLCSTLFRAKGVACRAIGGPFQYRDISVDSRGNLKPHYGLDDEILREADALSLGLALEPLAAERRLLARAAPLMHQAALECRSLSEQILLDSAKASAEQERLESSDLESLLESLRAMLDDLKRTRSRMKSLYDDSRLAVRSAGEASPEDTDVAWKVLQEKALQIEASEVEAQAAFTRANARIKELVLTLSLSGTRRKITVRPIVINKPRTPDTGSGDAR